MKLTPKQQIFADEYIVDFNATRAYKVAYPNIKKDETAAAAGNRLLRNVKVQKYIDERIQDRKKRIEVTQDKVIEELAKIAFTNGSDFAKVVEKEDKRTVLDEYGQKKEESFTYQTVEVINTDTIPKDKRAAISNIKETKFGISVETYDKTRALELLGKHLGIFTDKLEVSGDMNVNNPYKDLTKEQLLKIASEEDG